MLKFQSLQPFGVAFPTKNQKLSKSIDKISECISDKLYNLTPESAYLRFETSQLRGSDLSVILRSFYSVRTLAKFQMSCDQFNQADTKSLLALAQFLRANKKSLKVLQLKLPQQFICEGRVGLDAIIRVILNECQLIQLKLTLCGSKGYELEEISQLEINNVSLQGIRVIELTSRNYLSAQFVNSLLDYFKSKQLEKACFNVGGPCQQLHFNYIIPREEKLAVQLGLHFHQNQMPQTFLQNLIHSKGLAKLNLSFEKGYNPLYLVKSIPLFSLENLALQFSSNQFGQQQCRQSLLLACKSQSFQLKAKIRKLPVQCIVDGLIGIGKGEPNRTVSLSFQIEEQLMLFQILQMLASLLLERILLHLELHFQSKTKSVQLNLQQQTFSILHQDNTMLFTKAETLQLLNSYQQELQLYQLTEGAFGQVMQLLEQNQDFGLSLAFKGLVLYCKGEEAFPATIFKQNLIRMILRQSVLPVSFSCNVQNCFTVQRKKLEVVLPFDEANSRLDLLTSSVQTFADLLISNTTINDLVLFHSHQQPIDNICEAMEPVFLSRTWLSFQNCVSFKLKKGGLWKKLERMESIAGSMWRFLAIGAAANKLGLDCQTYMDLLNCYDND